MKAAEVDFADVLAKKNATISLRQIIRELEATQATVWSPLLLNGSGFGLWANHSLVMASYISRANAALIDLRELLAQGILAINTSRPDYRRTRATAGESSLSHLVCLIIQQPREQ